MLLNIYALRDSKAEAFNKPFYFLKDAEAARALIQAAQDPSSQIAQTPEDFAIFRLGTFDDQSGLIKLETQPRLLYNVYELQQIKGVDNEQVSDAAPIQSNSKK